MIMFAFHVQILWSFLGAGRRSWLLSRTAKVMVLDALPHASIAAIEMRQRATCFRPKLEIGWWPNSDWCGQLYQWIHNSHFGWLILLDLYIFFTIYQERYEESVALLCSTPEDMFQSYHDFKDKGAKRVFAYFSLQRWFDYLNPIV